MDERRQILLTATKDKKLWRAAFILLNELVQLDSRVGMVGIKEDKPCLALRRIGNCGEPCSTYLMNLCNCIAVQGW